MVRDELAQVPGQPSLRPDCGGARLNEAARSVLIAGRNLAEVITRLTVGQAREYFASLNSPWLARRSRRAHRQARSASACASWWTWGWTT
jgi:excinuclease UvrABC ATPase subunit